MGPGAMAAVFRTPAFNDALLGGPTCSWIVDLYPAGQILFPRYTGFGKRSRTPVDDMAGTDAGRELRR